MGGREGVGYERGDGVAGGEPDQQQAEETCWTGKAYSTLTLAAVDETN